MGRGVAMAMVLVLDLPEGRWEKAMAMALALDLLEDSSELVVKG